LKGEEKEDVKLHEYCKLSLYNPSGAWSARTVKALIAPGLCSPIILGLPFLERNKIVVDHELRTAISKIGNFDLLNPTPPTPPHPPKLRLREVFCKVVADCKIMVNDLKKVCEKRKRQVDSRSEKIKPLDIIGAIRQCVECLASQDALRLRGEAIKAEFRAVFEPIPHLNELPTDVYCRIQLKDASQRIQTHSYSTPRKYRDAWSTLIQEHLDAGRIRPSNSAHASPAFLVLKSDPTVLPRWVNDYHALNANTVIDSHPLPRIDDILADCGKGKIWSKMDMTNSFFQTRVHPDDVHLTAVTTPKGLYEWLAMPMGLRNSPPIHQCRVGGAL
jgi:hypothetical protein